MDIILINIGGRICRFGIFLHSNPRNFGGTLTQIPTNCPFSKNLRDLYQVSVIQSIDQCSSVPILLALVLRVQAKTVGSISPFFFISWLQLVVIFSFFCLLKTNRPEAAPFQSSGQSDARQKNGAEKLRQSTHQWVAYYNIRSPRGITPSDGPPSP